MASREEKAAALPVLVTTPPTDPQPQAEAGKPPRELSPPEVESTGRHKLISEQYDQLEATLCQDLDAIGVDLNDLSTKMLSIRQLLERFVKGENGILGEVRQQLPHLRELVEAFKLSPIDEVLEQIAHVRVGRATHSKKLRRYHA